MKRYHKINNFSTIRNTFYKNVYNYNSYRYLVSNDDEIYKPNNKLRKNNNLSQSSLNLVSTFHFTSN